MAQLKHPNCFQELQGQEGLGARQRWSLVNRGAELSLKADSVNAPFAQRCQDLVKVTEEFPAKTQRNTWTCRPGSRQASPRPLCSRSGSLASCEDPSGPADAARGPSPSSRCSVRVPSRGCRACPRPCGRVCPHRACLSQEGLFLPRTGASAGPSFSWAPGLQPLWFCSTACTCLSPGPLGPSSSLAARSLLLQVVFIGLSLGVGALSCFHGNCCGPQKTRAASSSKGRTLWAIPAISLETEDRNFRARFIRDNLQSFWNRINTRAPWRLTQLEKGEAEDPGSTEGECLSWGDVGH
nr:uncharacterized protein LOC106826203 [Equus asinus]